MGQDGRWYVHGVTSFVSSRVCNEAKKPTVFTRISAFKDWLNDVSQACDASHTLTSRSTVSKSDTSLHPLTSPVVSPGHDALLSTCWTLTDQMKMKILISCLFIFIFSIMIRHRDLTK